MLKKLGIFFVVLLSICILTENICKAGEILDDFQSRIFDIKLKIVLKSLDLKNAGVEKRKQDRLELLEMKYRGNVPAQVRQDTYRAEDAVNKAENVFKAIEGEIKSLKSEIVKYYKGNTPEGLKKGIDDLLASYYQESTEISKRAIEDMRAIQKEMQNNMERIR